MGQVKKKRLDWEGKIKTALLIFLVINAFLILRSLSLYLDNGIVYYFMGMFIIILLSMIVESRIRKEHLK